MPVETPVSDAVPLRRDPEATVRRLPALDGVRALAIILILFFHAGFSWLIGGFFSVDVFFVLSGFLITGLLVSEFRLSSTIGLKRFWGHRIRRLLPAMLALLVAVALWAWLFSPDDTLAQLRSDALATLFYSNNWHQASGGTGYFAEIHTPRLLLHTWTLSIEEQFYIVWPLIVLGLLRLTRSLAGLLVFCLAGTLASALAMSVLYDGGAGAARAYYGTDTRVQALLIGATLAVILAGPLPWRRRPQAEVGGHLTIAPVAEPTGWRRSAIGGLGLVSLAVLFTMFFTISSGDAWPYVGGFALASIAAAGLICSVALVPETPWARVLALRPIRYVGAISYGLYLWHWPIFVVVGPEQTGLTRWPLFALRVGLTFALAALSYRFLEMPIRRTALRGPRAWILAPVAFALTAVLILVATMAPAATRIPTHGATGLSPTLSARLEAAGAFGPHPVRFMLLGDSMAVTLRRGLKVDAHRRWGVQPQFTHPALGCDLDPLLLNNLQGVIAPATAGCRDWPRRWAGFVAAERPEVVGIVLGRWEALDHRLDGRWVHLGQPAWDAHVDADLRRAVDVVSARGAKVILYTMPYIDPAKAPDGSTYPENLPARTDAYNRILGQVAVSRPGIVTVVDLNALLDPAGHYASEVDGLTMRWADGVHLTYAAGLWLRPRLYPTVDQLAMDARDAAEGR
jgi:peptidoglycan/LPS O-acetylase OafA/YrhL